MNGPSTITACLPDAFAIVSGFHLQNEALDAGENEFADQVNETLVNILGEVHAHSVIDLGAAFSLIIIDLINRLACASGEPRDDLWRDVIANINARTERQNGENDG